MFWSLSNTAYQWDLLDDNARIIPYYCSPDSQSSTGPSRGIPPAATAGNRGRLGRQGWCVGGEQGGDRLVQEAEVNDMFMSVELNALDTAQIIFHPLQYSIYDLWLWIFFNYYRRISKVWLVEAAKWKICGFKYHRTISIGCLLHSRINFFSL